MIPLCSHSLFPKALHLIFRLSCLDEIICFIPSRNHSTFQMEIPCTRELHVQGYPPPPGALQQEYAQGPKVALGRRALSYARGTPVADQWLQRHPEAGSF